MYCPRVPREDNASRIGLSGGLLLAATILGIAVACDTPRQNALPPSQASPSPEVGAQFARRIECRRLGAERDKGSTNDVDSLNKGFMYFDSVYAYDEKLNTCVMLSGWRATNLKAGTSVLQATITDLLSNRDLAVYTTIQGADPTKKADFLKRVRELFGDPLPAWLNPS